MNLDLIINNYNFTKFHNLIKILSDATKLAFLQKFHLPSSHFPLSLELERDYMAEAALSFLLQELKDVVKWYKDLLAGAENEFQQLNDDLNFLKAFLRKAANVPEKDEVYKEMERQIREVVYVVEDTIDACLTKAAEAEAKKKKNPIRRVTSASTTIRLADDVKSLREKKVNPVLQKVRTDFATLGSALAASTNADQPPPKPKKVNYAYIFCFN